MKTTPLVIGGGNRWRRLRSLYELANFRDIILILFKAEAEDLKFLSGIRLLEIIICENLEEEIENIAQKLNLKYIDWFPLTLDDYYADFMIKLSLFSSHPIMTKESLSILRYKDQFRKMLDTVNYPECKGVKKVSFSIAENSDFYNDNIAFPVIVKPVNLDGSILISICNNAQDLKETISKTFSQLQLLSEVANSFGIYLGSSLVIEHFLLPPSEDSIQLNKGNFTIHLMVKNGIPVHIATAKHIKEGIITKGYLFIPMKDLSPPVKESILFSLKLAKALNIQNSLLNMEFLIKNDFEIYPIECNPRISGDFISEPLTIFVGINPILAISEGDLFKSFNFYEHYIYHKIIKFNKYINEIDATKLKSKNNIKIIFENETNIISKVLELNKSSVCVIAKGENQLHIINQIEEVINELSISFVENQDQFPLFN